MKKLMLVAALVLVAIGTVTAEDKKSDSNDSKAADTNRWVGVRGTAGLGIGSQTGGVF